MGNKKKHRTSGQEPAIPEVLTSLTPADAEEIHDQLGRPWTDVNSCILAFQADNTANQIASLDPRDIRILLLLGANSKELEPLQAVLEEVAARHGDDPFIVRSKAVENLKATAATGGDYLTFISFVEFLLRKKADPDLEWSIYKAAESSMDTALSFIARFDTQDAPNHKDNAKNALDGQPQPKGEGGIPLQPDSG